MHGYEIARYFQPGSELGLAVPADMSTIYTFLKDLQEQGLITGERVSVGARPPRTVFSVTDEARDLLNEWLRRPVGRMREVRLDFLLKLYFAERAGAAEAIQLIDAQIGACKGYLKRMRAAEPERDAGVFQHMVWESKLTAAQGVLVWLERLAERGIA
jgi:DNA-binding PadR family transcriptional regulator